MAAMTTSQAALSAADQPKAIAAAVTLAATHHTGRIGQSRPLIVSLLCAALAIYSLTLGITKFSFIAAMVPAFQMTAGSLGPALAALFAGTSRQLPTRTTDGHVLYRHGHAALLLCLLETARHAARSGRCRLSPTSNSGHWR